MKILYLPFIIQGLLMIFDECLHVKRGLGKWERMGHPLDTLTVFIPLSLVAFSDYSEAGLTAFIIMAVFSCIFITKDEFVHARECSPFEHWLHSLLFVIHPVIFLCSASIWKNHPDKLFLQVQVVLLGAFMIYQIFVWSFRWNTQQR